MPAPSLPEISPDVIRVLESYPPEIRDKLLSLRRLIFETAECKAVGPLTETLKWGEPAYLTEASKSGSTIRVGWKPSAPNRYAIYFNCRTDLIETFRHLFPREFSYQGNRAITFDVSDVLPAGPLATCIGLALTYHRDRWSAPCA